MHLWKYFIESLRTKLSIKHNLETRNHDDNLIDAGQQSDVSGEIDDRLSKLSMIPQDPGQTVDLSHVSEELKVIMEQLMSKYETAFAQHRYDTGSSICPRTKILRSSLKIILWAISIYARTTGQ